LTFWIKVFSSGICFLFGCVVGSFINVCIWRLPRARSIVRPSSRCPHCSGRIAIRDNVPLLSFLILRGRCRHCGGPISPRYPMVEALTGIMAVVVFLVFGFTVEAGGLFVLVCLLLVATFVDVDHMIIPDRVTLPGIVLGLALNTLQSPVTVWKYLAGALVGGGALLLVAFLGELLFRKESMGGGDIKLAAMVGAFLGWQDVLVALFLAILVGALVGIALIISRMRDRWQHIPFGPFIAAGTLITIFWGGEIITAYSRFLLL
jgi:leader peptidase (prepilin peptidase)/N-methyltransferase